MEVNSYRSELDQLLSDVAQHASRLCEKRVSLFTGQTGSSYSGELMIVGRAVNGGNESYDPADWAAPSTRASHLESALLRDGESLKWVAELWQAPTVDGKRPYRTSTSAFWRVIRQVLSRVDPTDLGGNWPNHVVWTNLYKVAPPTTGNPSARLARAQQPAAARALKRELLDHSPKRVLFLTGSDWFEPFAETLEFVEGPTPSSKLVQRVGTVLLSGKVASLIVAKHPQGKPESQFVSEVCEGFSTLEASA